MKFCNLYKYITSLRTGSFLNRTLRFFFEMNVVSKLLIIANIHGLSSWHAIRIILLTNCINDCDYGIIPKPGRKSTDKTRPLQTVFELRQFLTLFRTAALLHGLRDGVSERMSCVPRADHLPNGSVLSGMRR